MLYGRLVLMVNWYVPCGMFQDLCCNCSNHHPILLAFCLLLGALQEQARNQITSIASSVLTIEPGVQLTAGPSPKKLAASETAVPAQQEHAIPANDREVCLRQVEYICST